MENIRLNNGTMIPAMGIGTFLVEPVDAENAVFSAIRDGYAMVDTANAYMNEKAVGRAIKKSDIHRKDIYLSTKLWPSVYSAAKQAIDSTLARLDTDYIDLLFLHQPIGDYVGAYKAIEEAVKEGKVKSIGLSNFTLEQIKDMAEKMEIAPAVIQTEAHPYFPEAELKEYLNQIGAVLMAWYPLGHGDKRLIEETVFTDFARKYRKSNAQIILRWHIQMGNIVIPGSKNLGHIKANLDIFDFTLTAEEMKKIAAINKNIRYYTATEKALEGYLNFGPDFDSQK